MLLKNKKLVEQLRNTDFGNHQKNSDFFRHFRAFQANIVTYEFGNFKKTSTGKDLLTFLIKKKICCEFITRVIKNQEWLQNTFDPIV